MTTARPPRPLIVAHRGAAAIAPEHTIPAYEAAVAARVDALWLDVQESADEQLVVVHGDRLERTTTGRGRVRELTVRELKRLDAGRWFGRRYRGQRIQTLAEVLERFRGRVGFVVELRGGSDVYPGIEERALGLLHLYGVADRTLVASHDRLALARCRALDGDLRLGACVAGRPAGPAAVAPPGVLTALCLEAACVLETDVAACRAAGLECYLGVVTGAAEARRLAAWLPTALVMGSDLSF
ncbi:MAG TPA: glycerophosphodiester phosphodiesterase family protein [Methylomirabilota bacterium]|nr:glycerophosphodiester phosphodiesterase family protein [Methylomirabilota bacterium]